MKAKLNRKKIVAKNTCLFEFKLTRAVRFFPGQSFELTLPFGHRYFSIANSPSQKGLLTTVTRKGITPFKKALWRLKPGQQVLVSEIEGGFVLPKEKTVRQNLVLIAGGIGITPFVSMVRYIFEKKAHYNIILIYMNHDEASAPLLKEFRGYVGKLVNYKMFFLESGKRGRNLEKYLLPALRVLTSPLFYVAGPVQMVAATYQTLLDLGIKSRSIKTEEFTGY